jgi:hypothetical protein
VADSGYILGLTEREAEMTIETLIDQMKAKAEARGLSVRCPDCGAGAGKWCLEDMSVPHRTADQIVTHPNRVALAQSMKGFDARLEIVTDAMSGEYQRTTANPPVPKRLADVMVSREDLDAWDD